MVEEQALDTGTQNQDPVVESSNTTVQESATPTVETSKPATPAERMIPQSEVSRIAAREARDAAARKERELKAFYESQLAQHNQSQQQHVQPNQNMGGVQQYSEDQIRNLIQQEAWKMSQQTIANRIEQEWLSAMNAEKQNDPEFEQLYNALNIEAHPDLVLWANTLDNKAQVIKDMAKNPSKFSAILMLARSGSPELARMELNRLSSSIRANTEAQKQAQGVDAPLSQLKPQNFSADNGDMSVSDYRLIFRG